MAYVTFSSLRLLIFSYISCVQSSVWSKSTLSCNQLLERPSRWWLIFLTGEHVSTTNCTCPVHYSCHWNIYFQLHLIWGSFHGACYATNSLFIAMEATVGIYELHTYGGEQYDRHGDDNLSKTISFWSFFRLIFPKNDPCVCKFKRVIKKPLKISLNDNHKIYWSAT